MKAIIGLGNPGIQYAETRHNVGFLLVDTWAEALGVNFRQKYQGLVADGKMAGESFYFLKPMTFMNLSGRSVRELVNFHKIKSTDLLVIHDDMDLPFGKIRLKAKGGAGGHNGLKSIMGELGTDEFWRLRMGIGRPPERWDPARFVLAPFAKEELDGLDDVLAKAEAAAKLWLEGETNKAMNLYNR